MGAAHGESLAQLLTSDIAVECRTTVHWRDVELEDLRRLALDLAARGVARYAIPLARTGQCLDAHYAISPPEALFSTAIEALAATLRGAFQRLELRH